MALKHRISFATDLAANFDWNRFRIMPDIDSKLLRAAIRSRCAVQFQSEQTPFPWKGRISFATDLAVNFGCNRFRIVPDIVLWADSIYVFCCQWSCEYHWDELRSTIPVMSQSPSHSTWIISPSKYHKKTQVLLMISSKVKLFQVEKSVPAWLCLQQAGHIDYIYMYTWACSLKALTLWLQCGRRTPGQRLAHLFSQSFDHSLVWSDGQ